ncbi:MAG: aminotransferase class III-fold pyridoxal phosphate-dependent enzyme [Desulfurococcaceae archaeon]
MQNIDLKLSELIKELEAEYRAKTRKSMELYGKSINKLPAGVTYSLRYFHPYPLYIAKAKGTRVWDVDGNEYIDFWMGHGAHLLGHLPDVVVNAVKEALEAGTHFGFEHPYALEYVDLLSKIVPGLEELRFTNSGTEANMYAVRLARAYTGRKYIVKMQGGWHGSYDPLHVAVRSFNGKPESAGILEEYVKYTIAIPFNDVDALENAMRNHDVAAVIVEPIMGAAGCIEPRENYLREVRRVVDEHGSLLVFDEVITGFRLAPGGAQEYYGVKADIVVLGKALSGGVGSIGGFGGRSEIMDLLNHVKHVKPRESVFHGGTYTANLLAIAAGHALIKYLASNRGIYSEANSIWSYFRRRITDTCSSLSVDCWTTGDGTLTGIHFTRRKPRNAGEAVEYRWSNLAEKALHLYSRVNGVLYMSETHVHYLPSLIHGKREISKLLEVTEAFLEKLSRFSRE